MGVENLTRAGLEEQPFVPVTALLDPDPVDQPDTPVRQLPAAGALGPNVSPAAARAVRSPAGAKPVGTAAALGGSIVVSAQVNPSGSVLRADVSETLWRDKASGLSASLTGRVQQSSPVGKPDTTQVRGGATLNWDFKPAPWFKANAFGNVFGQLTTTAGLSTDAIGFTLGAGFNATLAQWSFAGSASTTFVHPLAPQPGPWSQTASASLNLSFRPNDQWRLFGGVQVDTGNLLAQGDAPVYVQAQIGAEARLPRNTSIVITAAHGLGQASGLPTTSFLRGGENSLRAELRIRH
jgi:hypothetical protein